MERNTIFDKLLRVNHLEAFYVKPILGRLLRTDALHFKLMLLCNAGEKNIAKSHHDQALNFKTISLRVIM